MGHSVLALCCLHVVSFADIETKEAEHCVGQV